VKNQAKLEKLRLEAAAARGLPSTAAKLLDGSTVEEIEQAADALVNLVGAHGDRPADRSGDREQPQRRPETADPLAAALAEGSSGKARRQDALVAALHPRRAQPRDEQEKLVGGGFDGGARTVAPSPSSPEAEHNEFLGSLIATKRADARGF
jgi:hypothetical protein